MHSFCASALQIPASPKAILRAKTGPARRDFARFSGILSSKDGGLTQCHKISTVVLCLVHEAADVLHDVRVVLFDLVAVEVAQLGGERPQLG